ncbi:MAG: pyridoxamine 5'-phosphate oxidase family protein [Deltaproteobacteria bacterium]|nr:pyridoxamine 5'-phosphate oxidase family protein [Deltaproteobacteria bacterium]
MVVPKEVKSMLGKGKIIAFAPTDKDGMPNIVPILQHWRFDDDVMAIGDLLLKASRENVLDNGRVYMFSHRFTQIHTYGHR